MDSQVTKISTRNDPRQQTLASFDWQWANLPSGDFMPGDLWFDAHAPQLLAEELCAIAPVWFVGKRVLDAGCGRGRWTRALLELGARVTAVDYSAAGIAQTRELCGPTDRLETKRVDLLDIPPDLSTERFDLVFSFGVLHHTGDSWRALDNVARLVDDSGALFLYLYGAKSWESAEQQRIRRLREELAILPFDEKILELKRRFPEEDPHQLFDLLSPVINDRLLFEEVAARLKNLGFHRVEQTITSTEVYLRATRRGFPPEALLPCVQGNSSFVAEVARRDALRRGAAFENNIREALRSVVPRPPEISIVTQLRAQISGSTILDFSLPPDRLPAAIFPACKIHYWDGPSLITPGLKADEFAGAVFFLGAALGACRHPNSMLELLWDRVQPGGLLALEMVEDGFPEATRLFFDKLIDYKKGVPEKLARLLSRRVNWCSGEGLFAIGGRNLLDPLAVTVAARTLRERGAASILTQPTQRGTVLLLAQRPDN